jgi:hypothetical protein
MRASRPSRNGRDGIATIDDARPKLVVRAAWRMNIAGRMSHVRVSAAGMHRSDAQWP